MDPDGSASELHVVLVHPEIPWNTGNVGRTCLALDARLHLVQPLGFSLDERQVRRAGLDYWHRVSPQVWPDWSSFERRLAALGEPFLLTADSGAELWSVSFPRRCVLVFGAEGTGLPRALLRRHHESLVRIPMPGAGVRSLNLSTAVAVAAFEVRRQWAAESRGSSRCPIRSGRAGQDASAEGVPSTKHRSTPSQPES